MSDKHDIQIALAAAVGSNCIPCFDHLFERTREVGLSTKEVQHVIQLATRVKNGAQVFLKTHMDDTLGVTEEESTEGCCGPSGKGGCGC